MSINVNRFINYWDIFRLGKRKPKTIPEFVTRVFCGEGIEDFIMKRSRDGKITRIDSYDFLRVNDVLSFEATMLGGSEFFTYKDLKYTSNVLFPEWSSAETISTPLSELEIPVTQEMLDAYSELGLSYMAEAELTPQGDPSSVQFLIKEPSVGGSVKCAWMDYNEFRTGEKIDEQGEHIPYTIIDEHFNEVGSYEYIGFDKVGKMTNALIVAGNLLVSYDETTEENIWIGHLTGAGDFQLDTPIYNTIYIVDSTDDTEIASLTLTSKTSTSDLQPGEAFFENDSHKLTYKIYDSYKYGSVKAYYATASTFAEMGITSLQEKALSLKSIPDGEEYKYIDLLKSRVVNIQDETVQEGMYQIFYSVTEYDEESKTGEDAEYRALYVANIIDDFGYGNSNKQNEGGLSELLGDWIIAPKFFKHSDEMEVFVDQGIQDIGENGLRSIKISNFAINKIKTDFPSYNLELIKRNAELEFNADEYVFRDMFGQSERPTGRAIKSLKVNFYDLFGDPEHSAPVVWHYENPNVDYPNKNEKCILSLDDVRQQIKDLDCAVIQIGVDETVVDPNITSEGLRFTNRTLVGVDSPSGFGVIMGEDNDKDCYDFYDVNDTLKFKYKKNQSASSSKDITTVLNPNRIEYKQMYSPYETIADKYDYSIPYDWTSGEKGPLYSQTITDDMVEDSKNRGYSYTLGTDLVTNTHPVGTGEGVNNNNLLFTTTTKLVGYDDDTKYISVPYELKFYFWGPEPQWTQISTSGAVIGPDWQYVNNAMTYEFDWHEVQDLKQYRRPIKVEVKIKDNDEASSMGTISEYHPALRFKVVDTSSRAPQGEQIIPWGLFKKEAAEEGYKEIRSFILNTANQDDVTSESQWWYVTGTYHFDLSYQFPYENVSSFYIKNDNVMKEKAVDAMPKIYKQTPSNWLTPGQTLTLHDCQLSRGASTQSYVGFVGVRDFDEFSVGIQSRYSLTTLYYMWADKKPSLRLYYSPTGSWDDKQYIFSKTTNDIVELEPLITKEQWNSAETKTCGWGKLCVNDYYVREPSKQPLSEKLEQDWGVSGNQPTIFFDIFHLD